MAPSNCETFTWITSSVFSPAAGAVTLKVSADVAYKLSKCASTRKLEFSGTGLQDLPAEMLEAVMESLYHDVGGKAVRIKSVASWLREAAQEVEDKLPPGW